MEMLPISQLTQKRELLQQDQLLTVKGLKSTSSVFLGYRSSIIVTSLVRYTKEVNLKLAALLNCAFKVCQHAHSSFRVSSLI